MIPLPTLALTLRQPWATLVIHCEKDIENRGWAPVLLQPGDRFWIHASKALDADDRANVDDARHDIPLFDEYPMPLGELMGHVRFDGVVRERDRPTSKWFLGPVGWKLSDPVPLSKSVPVRGAQGLSTVPEETLELVRRQIEADRNAYFARARAMRREMFSR